MTKRKNRAKSHDKTKFSIHDLHHINPLTTSQKESFISYNSNMNPVLYGFAGTGKTMISMFLALRDVLDEQQVYNRLIIVRSCVPTRDIGYLPGTKEEKEEIYEQPFVEICDRLFSYKNSYKNLKAGGYIKFVSTSFIRGITLDNSIVFVDEAQNMTFHELDSIITRLGKNCKIIISGDTLQCDLSNRKNDVSGFMDIIRILDRMDEFSVIWFGHDDIVRSKLVRNYILMKHTLNHSKTGEQHAI